jgi:hypothetical protein
MFRNRSLVTVIASAAAFGATMMVPAPLAHAEGPYVAMAASRSSGDAGKFYVRTSCSSRAQCEQNVLNDCQKKESDCEVTGSTDRCMATVQSGNNLDVGFGDAAAEAASAAQAKIPDGNTSKGHCASD